MALIDRIVHSATGDIPIHEFSAAIFLWANGDITRQNIIDLWSLSVDDVTGLDALKVKIDAESTVAAKSNWIHKLESAGLFYANGVITATKYKSIMGV